LKSITLAALSVVALAVQAPAHASTPTLDVFESHGTLHYAMVPSDKAQDTGYIEQAARAFCQSQNKGHCRVRIWSESLDRPTGLNHHPRYDDNVLGEFVRGYGGATQGMLFHCKIVQKASRCYQN
jgi:hypothetical protein